MQRSLLLSCIIFLTLMCLVLSLQTYHSFSACFYEEYDENLAHTITGVEHRIDVDDMQECVRTGVPSEKHAEVQAFFNEYVDDYGLDYLYLSIPHENGTMVSIVASTSEAEREAGDSEDWPMLYEDDENYTPESIKPYLEAWDSPDVTYFETDSDWGLCYTACKPLVASDGETVALLCADLFIDSMHDEINRHVVQSALLSCAIGVSFVILLMFWLRHDVTLPIRKLERSARNFAKRSHKRRDPSMLLFDDPHINTQNEIESLSDAILQMSKDMQAYVADIIQAETRARSAQEEAEGMSRIAFEDSLTHVRSKAAYTRAVELIKEDIDAGRAEFAVIMVDLNNLKYVNDTFGHESGDKYIVGGCGIISEVLDGVPVYRTGGDEFVAVLQGEHYGRCVALLKDLQARFAVSQDDASVEPWERYSAACGMAKYRRGESYEDVFARADHTMYRNKSKMKRRASRT